MSQLVCYKDNYADEFDFEGFRIFGDGEFEEYLEKVKKIFENKEKKLLERRTKARINHQFPLDMPDEEIRKKYYNREILYGTYVDCTLDVHNVELEVYYGTNEFVTVDSYQDYVNNCSVTLITQAQEDFLRSVLGDSFGETCMLFLDESLDFELDDYE